jgi:hypothetical protein
MSQLGYFTTSNDCTGSKLLPICPSPQKVVRAGRESTTNYFLLVYSQLTHEESA